MEIVLGIGDYAVSNQEADVIKTYALGSCVAITLYSPLRKVLAMAHIALPTSTVDPHKSKASPAHFADTAIPMLFDKMYFEYGCLKEELVIHLIGGSKSTWETDIFNVGERNILAIKKILTEMGLNWTAKETGGSFGRTVEIDVATGTPKVNRYPIDLAAKS
ncbi:MAG TPA: chemotaxis protein CheD [Bacillota bacterium]|nr:chemotaxis protein CheD [Bacillota bacterium]